VIRNNRGSAAVETVVVFLTLPALLAGTLGLGRLALSIHRAHALARLGAALAAAGVARDVVDGELAAYARRIGAENMTWDLHRFTGSPSASFYRLTESVVSAAVGGWTFQERAVVEEEPS
jgi:Flp pilus assembly protein TadG